MAQWCRPKFLGPTEFKLEMGLCGLFVDDWGGMHPQHLQLKDQEGDKVKGLCSRPWRVSAGHSEQC